MIAAGDIRPNMKVELDGDPYLVVNADHVKPGKGQAFSRFRLKNLRTGAVIEKTYNLGETLKNADFLVRKMQSLSSQHDNAVFMDMETYDQIEVPFSVIENERYFLQENLEVKVLLFKGSPVGVDLPAAVELTVVETEPGVKGDTASGGTKPAKLETGAVVQVPFFINEGDKVKVDTRKGEYLERVK